MKTLTSIILLIALIIDIFSSLASCLLNSHLTVTPMHLLLAGIPPIFIFTLYYKLHKYSTFKDDIFMLDELKEFVINAFITTAISIIIRIISTIIGRLLFTGDDNG